MQSILHHNSSGRFAFTGSLKSKEIHNAITLHPVKMAPLMYRLHAYMQGLRAQELRQQSLQLHRDIAAMKTLLTEGSSAADDVLSGMPPIFPDGPESDRYLGDHSVLGERRGYLIFRAPYNSKIIRYGKKMSFFGPEKKTTIFYPLKEYRRVIWDTLKGGDSIARLYKYSVVR